MTDQLINELRQYLLTFDDAQKEQLKRNFSENNFQIIARIEKAFLTDMKIGKIIDDFSLISFQEEIRDLHAEFYLDLAECFSEGKTNTYIKHLLDTNNETFKKTVKMFPDESTFLRELIIAIDDNKTQKLVEGYALVDEWLESKKVNKKAAASIIPIGRKIFHYAIAAAVVGVMIGGAYLTFFNNEINSDNSLAHSDSVNNNKPLVANFELPDLIESSESNKIIIIDKASSGLAILNESINIKTNGLTKQIDTLRAILEVMIPDRVNTLQNSKISGQIDSLTEIINTYTYDYKNKKMILNVPKVSVVENIISLNPNNLSDLYLRIGDRYYLIKNTQNRLKLSPVTEKSLIEQLRRIEFINQ